MNERLRERTPLLLALAAATVALGMGVALLAAGGDDDGKRKAPSISPGTKSEGGRRPQPTVETVPAVPPAPREERAAERRQARDADEIRAAVRGLVEASEQSDDARVCRLLGPAAKGGQTADACAGGAGFERASLPTSDEFSIARVSVADDTGSVILAGGTRFSLRQANGRWHIKRVKTVVPGGP